MENPFAKSVALERTSATVRTHRLSIWALFSRLLAGSERQRSCTGTPSIYVLYTNRRRSRRTVDRGARARAEAAEVRREAIKRERERAPVARSRRGRCGGGSSVAAARARGRENKKTRAVREESRRYRELSASASSRCIVVAATHGGTPCPGDFVEESSGKRYREREGERGSLGRTRGASPREHLSRAPDAASSHRTARDRCHCRGRLGWFDDTCCSRYRTPSIDMSMKKESPWDVELHLAAARGDGKRLQVLLDSGRVHVDCKDKDGTTPLILAAAGGHIDAVVELLQQGAEPNAKRLTGTTALFFSAQGGYMDIATVLIKHGASVDCCSIDGGTPLFVACQCGHLDVVEALLAKGADVNAHMKDGATALFIAAQNGHVRILEVLLAHGARTEAARTDGATPLWIAAQMGHDHVVRRLLKTGSKVDSKRHDGATPLFKAAHKGHTAVIGEILKYRPNLGILPNGESALHAAALMGHMTVARQLVGAGADPLLVNQEGLTPLQIALRHSQNQVANYLKDKIRSRTTTC